MGKQSRSENINFIVHFSRFEASVCREKKMERLSSGPLDQLELHLPIVKEFNSEFDDIFKLQLPDRLKGSSWFSKSTLSM